MLTSQRIRVYRLRPGVRTDSSGDTVRDWANPQRDRIPRAVDFQVGPSHDRDGIVTVREDGARLFVEGPVDVTGDDRVEYRGAVWRVDGNPDTKGVTLAAPTPSVVNLKRLEAT
jgi:hypothetical protein